MKKLFILLVKYIPIIQMVGMLLNNILYYFDTIYSASYILDFIIGNSVITTFLLIVCSYTFMFCNWHRLIILGNFVNIGITNVDCLIHIPISDAKLLMSYVIVDTIFIILALYYNFKCRKIC